jgi:DNA-binding MarR family transcriptional regulator
VTALEHIPAVRRERYERLEIAKNGHLHERARPKNFDVTSRDGRRRIRRLCLDIHLGVYTLSVMDAANAISECANCLCLASRRAARAITSAYDRRLRPHGIRITQFSILAMLMLRGPTALGELAKGLGLERTTLTRNLALLDSKGWIAIRPGDADSRARIITVTKTGRLLVHKAYPDWRKVQEQFSGAFGEAGVDALRKLARTTIR